MYSSFYNFYNYIDKNNVAEAKFKRSKFNELNERQNNVFISSQMKYEFLK